MPGGGMGGMGGMDMASMMGGGAGGGMGGMDMEGKVFQTWPLPVDRNCRLWELVKRLLYSHVLSAIDYLNSYWYTALMKQMGGMKGMDGPPGGDDDEDEGDDEDLDDLPDLEES